MKLKKKLKNAHDMCQEKMGVNHPLTANIIYELGCFFFIKPEELGYKTEKSWNIDKAEKWLLRAFESIKEAVGEDHPDCARVLNRLGSLYIERTQFGPAEEYLTKALNIRTKKLGLYHSRVAQTYKHMLTLYQLQEKLKLATDCGTKSLEILSRLYGNDTVQYAFILLRLAEISTKAGTIEISKTILAEVITIFEARNSIEHIETTRQLLDTLSRPPPPPPPPLPLNLTPPELAPEATEDMKKQNTRQQLLSEIVNFGKKKTQLAHGEQKLASNEELKRQWWKQNYKGNKVLLHQHLKDEQVVQYSEEADDDAYFLDNVQHIFKK